MTVADILTRKADDYRAMVEEHSFNIPRELVPVVQVMALQVTEIVLRELASALEEDE